ncbi:MAG TPA: peptide chain release factor N(5)-glutamine methyltransferase [Sedimentibacter sp.]|jgi:release factor glutamine methyltransferase|nr:peptide chain release factor N(5)-glutamine methyltransferase [Sedimentibacter sp.]HOA19395.1 peptide chain release factor N(5)-glutamine methyltransferase [Sedimentibacter sp.]HOG62548.1 peptide chain release factor N(5)-glutamine methyltransferase [Sedimentibacter sp.]HPV84998.1 peptide chain release factor N(5)-glutamine methyltransferase [Sedimentibacter sp.]HPY56225.1 peptide chain release factor N(5)-glutamine methyltransferase [Sedimentibacter sp.]
MVTIEKLLKDGIDIIKQREFNSPKLEVELILCYLLQKDRIYLHLNRKEEVSEEIKDKFYKLAEKRNNGYPLQYITNSQEFMGLDFYVQEGVLIPRPDTETLVETVINIVKERYNKEIKILDLGTGSGAIALSLAYYLRNSFVTAIDISDIAVETTKINIKKHNLNNIKVIKGNIFEDILGEKFDVLVSNPPYIESDEIKNLQTEVSVYEPRLALDGGVDGLDYYKPIVELFKKICEENGVLAVEIGRQQKKSVEEIFLNSKVFKEVKAYRDLAGNDRVIIGMT